MTLNDFIEQKVIEWLNSGHVLSVDFLRSALRECAEMTVAEWHRIYVLWDTGHTSAGTKLKMEQDWFGTSDQPHA